MWEIKSKDTQANYLQTAPQQADFITDVVRSLNWKLTADQQRASWTEVLVDKMAVTLPASREYVWGGNIPPEPCKRTQLGLDFMRFSPRNSGAVREGRWRQQHSLAQVQKRKNKASLHALCQHPLSLQQEQTPAQIAFNIQTLLNVQFISSSMETFFLEKLLLFFNHYFQLKSMKT